MFYDLIRLTWFDAISVVGTLLSVLLVQLLNAQSQIEAENSNKSNATATATATTKTITTTTTDTPKIIPNNGQLQKQKSEFSDDLKSPSTPATPTAPTIIRHSLTSLNGEGNHILLSHGKLTSTESFGDEYHEDEDTLSLDNLFPCDQSEIYASKKISFIIDELIETENNYVNNLRKGLRNYGKLHERQDVPDALRGPEKQTLLLGNIDEILELHEHQILPLMLRNQRDLKTLFDEFAAHFEKDNFYAYVIFMMNKKTSMQLRQEQREWFQNLQNEINDKLGIDSFLVQPVQRLTRYPLLLQQFISEFYKSGISCKPVLSSVCKLETRMRRMLEVVNQAEEIPSIDDINELNASQQGRFRRSTEFDAYHYRTRKKYRSKIFLFDRCLLCAEVRKKRLVYRQHLPWESIELQLNNSKSITILQKSSDNKREEYELSSPEAISVTNWLRCAHKIINTARLELAERGKFSLPMDLVLGMALAIWLIWKYLY